MFLLAVASMIPNSGKLLKILVETGKNGEIIVNKKMETSNPDIYAAGDVVGGIGTTPVARMEGVVAARNACGIAAQVDYRFIPSSLSLYYDVSYINSNENGVEGHIPGSAGPGAFWNSILLSKYLLLYSSSRGSPTSIMFAFIPLLPRFEAATAIFSKIVEPDDRSMRW